MNIRLLVKNIPLVNRLVKSRAWLSFRFRIGLLTAERQSAPYTRFLRSPSQFEALTGPVLDFLLADDAPKELKIVIAGCSNGAEAYSVASVLLNRRPDVAFTINAFDIDEKMIELAETASYERGHVFSNDKITTDFIEDTFYKENDRYVVKPEITKHVRLRVANALDPDLKKQIGTSDIVYAQNFLYHLKPKLGRIAYNNLCRLLKLRAALFIDGMDPWARLRLTRANRLEPLDYKIEQIHEEAKAQTGGGWPYTYWALEPFSASRRNWKRRYSTIFLRDDSTRD